MQLAPNRRSFSGDHPDYPRYPWQTCSFLFFLCSQDCAPRTKSARCPSRGVILVKLNIPVIVLLACLGASANAQRTASHGSATGFTCSGINTRSTISFNIDLNRKRIEWQNGDTEKIIIKSNEIRVYRDPFVSLYSEYMHGRYLDRTTLIYTDISVQKSTNEEILLTYRCTMAPAYSFGSQRKF